MVEKVKVWANVNGPRTMTIMACNVMHPCRIAELALLEGVWFGKEHPVIAEPAFTLRWQRHIEMADRYMVYPAVDVVEVESLLAIAIPIEFAGEPPLSTTRSYREQVRQLRWPSKATMSKRNEGIPW
ncbi:hypothetical protein CCMA1212_006110 [Trichoderma ghanense]|uniref:Uncharacterized protein n=1 Tax=Trichoderma ghanense TaxID=65468 RepID=A0ABY2H3U5_9HYPO